VQDYVPLVDVSKAQDTEELTASEFSKPLRVANFEEYVNEALKTGLFKDQHEVSHRFKMQKE